MQCFDDSDFEFDEEDEDFDEYGSEEGSGEDQSGIDDSEFNR